MKCQIIFVIIWVLFVPNKGFTDKICEDLFLYTCSPGEYEDGTGKAENPGVLERVMPSEIKKIESETQKLFESILSDPNERYFRNLAMAATGLDMNSQCKLVDDLSIKSCNRLLTKGLIDRALETLDSKLRPIIRPDYNQILLSDELLLRENPNFTNVTNQLKQKVRITLDAEQLVKKIAEHAFPEVKRILLSKLSKWVADEKTRTLIENKITGIKFKGTDCDSLFADKDLHLPTVFMANAFYMPDKNIFMYCQGIQKNNTSLYNIIHFISHEISHSIDPCRITIGPTGNRFEYSQPKDLNQSEIEFPFSGLVKCLRDKKSVGAFNFSESSNYLEDRECKSSDENTVEESTGLTVSVKSNLEFESCENEDEKSDTMPKFCENDQINEAFCDWVAVEIMAEYFEQNNENYSKEQIRNGYSNVFRGLCRSFDNTYNVGTGPSEHPNTSLRVNNIILANPKVRKQMGCFDLPKNKIYCSVDKDNHATSTKPTSSNDGVN